MAPKMKRNQAGLEDSVAGYISDESDFYGDKDTIVNLEDRANDFSVQSWLQNRPIPLEGIAKENIGKAKTIQPVTLYNPYESCPHARHLDESIEEFCKRLPPLSTKTSQAPWIYIANPYCKAPKREHDDHHHHLVGDFTDEGPPNDHSEWGKFVAKGHKALEELTIVKNTIEKKRVKQSKAAITKAVNVEKDTIVKQLLDSAAELHCTSGKWMIFCSPEEVNEVWMIVARATANNDLGVAAKVAPSDGFDDRKQRLLCIYTKDFTDLEDVTRVVEKLKDLGLVEAAGKPIYYKCDAYTYLAIKSDNKWGIKASLYNSGDFLKTKTQLANETKQGHGKGFFYKAKKVPGDWKEAEWS